MKDHKFETLMTVVASTAHVTQKDMALLESLNCPLPTYSTGYGQDVYLSEDETIETITMHDFSKEFAQLCIDAREHGAKYLRLDCDGEVYEDRKSFDW